MVEAVVVVDGHDVAHDGDSDEVVAVSSRGAVCVVTSAVMVVVDVHPHSSPSLSLFS